MKELISSLLLWLSIAALCWLFAMVTPPQYNAESDISRAETEGRAE